MTDRLDIDVLRTLKAIRDFGGVTRAAEHLALTQSAVSHKIRRFEQSIGCQLLRRKPGQGLFTSDGKHLVAYAEKIISIHDEALLGINRPTLSGQVHLGITEEMVNTGLAQVLGRFGRLYPGVRVKTRVEQSLVLDEQLKDAQIDMAVMQVFRHEVASGDLTMQQDRLVWAKAIDYEMPDDGRIPFIAFDQNCFYRQWAARELAGSDKKLDVVLECASNEGVTSAILAGMGAALIAERHLQPGMERLDIVQAPGIVFVIRCARASPAKHLAALRDDIFESLSDRPG